jgi:hypothetical protein
MIVATPAAATTPAPTGGAVAGPAPKIKALQCRTACMGVMAGHIGSRVRVKGVKGKSLKRIDSVVFEGAPRHVGQVMDVRITDAQNFTLYGDPAIL